MINYLMQSLEKKLLIEARQRDVEYMQKVWFWEQEKELTRIRKYTYQAMKGEVKRGIRNSVDLLEFEIWRGF